MLLVLLVCVVYVIAIAAAWWKVMLVNFHFGCFVHSVRRASPLVVRPGIFLPTSDTFEHYLARLCPL
jgi:hypothetical protein